MKQKKDKWFESAEELCKFLSDQKVGKVHGGFYDSQGQDAGMCRTNYGNQNNWPIPLVVLIGDGICRECGKKRHVKMWNTVGKVKGDIVSSWETDTELPERIKDWPKSPFFQDVEIFWWWFD